MNKHLKENLLVVGLVVAIGTLFGALADLIPWLSLV